MPTAKTLISHQVQTLNRTSSLASHGVLVRLISSTIATHNVISFKISNPLMSHHIFIQTERVIYATNTVTNVTTKLGSLLPGQLTLTDVSLPDGTYNIEVRSSQNLYQEAHSRIRFPLEIVAGVIASQGVPSINDLRAVLTKGFKTKLEWTIPDVAFVSGLKFGIWRSATSPVDVSGPPDFETLAYEGLGKYSFIVTQTADEYFAIAAISGSEQGPESEVLNVWDLTAPTSPANQFWK
jgi:hypothetical protein